MRLVIQRCKGASVKVGGELISEIGRGLLVLVGVEVGDTAEAARKLALKTAALRIFADEAGAMNLNVVQAGGNVLVVSQFTLLASTRRGNRPSFVRAARQEEAEPLYEAYCRELASATGCTVGRGVFGADMQVALVNDGPVTIVIDSNIDL